MSRRLRGLGATWAAAGDPPDRAAARARACCAFLLLASLGSNILSVLRRRHRRTGRGSARSSCAGRLQGPAGLLPRPRPRALARQILVSAAVQGCDNQGSGDSGALLFFPAAAAALAAQRRPSAAAQRSGAESLWRAGTDCGLHRERDVPQALGQRGPLSPPRRASPAVARAEPRGQYRKIRRAL